MIAANQPLESFSFHVITNHSRSFLHTNRCAKSTGRKGRWGERRLAALGDTALDALELDVVGIVGLDIGGETVEGALDSFLGGRVHHAGLSIVS